MVAVIAGASKGIGFSFVKRLLETTDMPIIAASRNKRAFEANMARSNSNWSARVKFVEMDVSNEETIRSAAERIKKIHGDRCVRLHVQCAGYLRPEKSLRAIDVDEAFQHFRINAVGPMLVAKHFHSLLALHSSATSPFRHSVWINLSARTGSIGDNRLGGWHSYRMSKASLNQLTKTMSVELQRRGSIVVSMHPGTVNTDLSRDFVKNVDPNKLFTADDSVEKMMDVIRKLGPDDNGKFLDYAGKPIPW